MRLRIAKIEHSDNTGKIWYTYIPQYKCWDDIFWQPFYLFDAIMEYGDCEDAEEVIKNKAKALSHKTTIVDTIGFDYKGDRI